MANQYGMTAAQYKKVFGKDYVQAKLPTSNSLTKPKAVTSPAIPKITTPKKRTVSSNNLRQAIGGGGSKTSSVGDLQKQLDAARQNVNTGAKVAEGSKSNAAQFIIANRKLKEAQRAEQDRLHGNNPFYKREVFNWEKEGYDPVKGLPGDEDKLRQLNAMGGASDAGLAAKAAGEFNEASVIPSPIASENPADILRSAISGPVEEEVASGGGQTTNITDLIKRRNEETTKALVTRLKQRIAESIAGQEQSKAGVAEQLNPLRAASEVSKSQSLRSALERSSNLGDRGGIGRSEALATQTAGENRLGAIDLQQQNFINQADAEILRLENEGRFQEAEILASQKALELDDLITETRRQEDIARQEKFRTEGLTLDERLRQEDLALNEKLRTENLARQDELSAGRDTEAAFNRELQTIGQYSSDYQAEINRRTAINPNDPLIDYLELARQGKLGDIAQAEEDQLIRQREDVQAYEQETYDRAIKTWDQGRPLYGDEAQVLRVQEGSTKPVKKAVVKDTTQSDLRSLAKWKVSQDLELSQEERNALNLPEGFDASTEVDTGLDTKIIRESIDNAIGIRPDNRIIDLEKRLSALGDNEFTERQNLTEQLRDLQSQGPSSENERIGAMKWVIENQGAFGATPEGQINPKLLEIMSVYGFDDEDLINQEAIINQFPQRP